MMDEAERSALAHYEQLIACRVPPHLAAALAAARYQTTIAQAALPVVRDTLIKVQETHPDLKRDVGRTVAAIDRKGTMKGRTNHRS